MPSNRSSWATSEAPAGDTASRPRDRHKIPLARFANEKSGKLESANSQSQKTTEGQTKEATTETSVKSPDVKFEKRSKKAQKKSKVLFIAALIVIAFVVGVVVVLPKFDTTAEAAKPTTLVPPRIPTTTINPSKTSRHYIHAYYNDSKRSKQEEVYEIGGAYPNVTNLKLLSTTWQIPTENYRPLGYQLRLFVRLPGYGIDDAPIPKKLHWTTLGKVRILIEIDKNPENFIELHSKNLKIKAATLREVQLKNKNEDAIFKYKLVGQTRRLAFQHNEQIERVGFGDGKPILAGKYILEIVYDGEINNTLTGLYSSCTTDSQIKKGSCIATTQMEPTNARMMVPCFDEPRFKAIWSLIIFHPTGTEANSNMNSEFSEIDSITGSEARLTWNITKFANTPKMSSYLLALVVHAWEGPDTITTNNVEIRALSSFEQFFGVKYPLPKLDLFAVARYGEGAMENWGLMIFKERWLLVDPKHESIGHQWFGNLVTMNWWNEIWLNEGFADFAEFLGRLSHMSFDDAVIEYLLNERNKIMYGEVAYAQNGWSKISKQKYPDGRYNRCPRTPIEIRYMFDMHAYKRRPWNLLNIQSFGSSSLFTNIKAYLDKHKYSTSHSMDVLGEDLFKDQLWINAQKILEDHLTNIDEAIPRSKTGQKEKGLIERNLISAFPPIINMDGRAYTRVCYGKNWPLVFQAFRFAISFAYSDSHLRRFVLYGCCWTSQLWDCSRVRIFSLK
ncbi:unnamed protein product, partial [Mesorhabditis belari]|uniref:Aminopeptidase n=1 Tax=Mesorhabditis belari TaxID=2138241 RepID=A0AAF3ESC9_9BILA